MKLMRKTERKQQRQITILYGLIELFLSTGRAVGSTTLQEHGFGDISSATIRNYFSKLEELGFLRQQHSSGGRIPTKQGFANYTAAHLDSTNIASEDARVLNDSLANDTKEIVGMLQTSAEALSKVTGHAVLVSSPRFDQDLIIKIKLSSIDDKRALCIMVTDFGLIHTELLYLPYKLSSFAVKRMESFFQSKVTGEDYPRMYAKEEELASKLYEEIVLRHIIKYSQFTCEDIYTTGLSKLINANDDASSSTLALSLSLFENSSLIKKILDESAKKGSLDCFIGIDRFLPNNTNYDHTAIITIPYFINGKPVGSIAIFGPLRTNYKRIFAILNYFSTHLSHRLSRNLYKHNISFRQPAPLPLENLSQETKKLPLTNHL